MVINPCFTLLNYLFWKFFKKIDDVKLYLLDVLVILRFKKYYAFFFF